MSSQNDESNVGRESQRYEAVRNAVAAADRIILDGSDGTPEETDYLTAAVSAALADKVKLAAYRQLVAGEVISFVAEQEGAQPGVDG